MKLLNLAENLSLECLNGEEERNINGVYCCDLLSVVMGKAPADCAWVTVMANINAVAVASLAEIGVIVFADGVKPEAMVIEKAKENNINILLSNDNIFDTALKIYEALEND
jgi:hypothetical protein